jgi:hypothetical protein
MRRLASAVLVVGILTAGCGAGHNTSSNPAPLLRSHACFTGWSACLTRLAQQTGPGVLGPAVGSDDRFTVARVAPTPKPSIDVTYEYAFDGLPGARVFVLSVPMQPLVLKNFVSTQHESWTTIRGHRARLLTTPSSGSHVLTWNERGRQWSVVFPAGVKVRDARADVSAFTPYGV